MSDLHDFARIGLVAAGGVHENYDEYDRIMAAERRTIVFIAPERVYSNR